MAETPNEPFDTYEQSEKSWLEIEPNLRTPKYYPKQTKAKDFGYDLKCLYIDTGDEKFLHAYHALAAHNVIADNGTWNNKFRDIDEIAVEEAVIFLANAAFAEGASERTALAYAASGAFISANSFEAAWTKARRIWRSHQAILQKGSPSLSNDA